MDKPILDLCFNAISTQSMLGIHYTLSSLYAGAQKPTQEIIIIVISLLHLDSR